MILAANNWKTNADLILDCKELGYIGEWDICLDPTYGQGKFWTKWKPEWLIAVDIKPQKDFVRPGNFHNLIFLDDLFDSAVFDPPYVSTGGRSTSTIPDFNSRYGLTEAPKTPNLLQEYNNKGFTEVTRVVKRGGFILVKCKDYISSGKYFAGTHYTLQHGLDVLGLELQDRFEMIGKPGMQPKRTRKDGKPSVQQHARRNLSTLLVFKK